MLFRARQARVSFCVEALSGHCVHPSAKGDVPDVVRRWPPWRRHFSLAQTPQCLACRAAPVSLASLRNRRHGAGAAVDALSGRIQSGVARSLTRFFSCTSFYRTVLATSPSVRFTKDQPRCLDQKVADGELVFAASLDALRGM